MSKILLLCGALAWTSQAATVTVTTNPTQATFSYQIGAPKIPSVQTVSVKASSGTPAFTATTPGTDQWLTVDPSSGNLPASLNIRVNPTTLPASTYNSSVTVTITGLPQVNIPVTMVVSPPAPALTVSPSTMAFSAPPFTASSQSLSLSTSGAPISFVATPGAKWMTLNHTVGVVLPGPPTTLTVTVDPSSLTPQTNPYTAKITLALSGASVKSLNVTVNVSVSSPIPTISSVWPNKLPLNGTAQTITIIGTNFYAATVAKVQGVSAALATTAFKDSSTLLQAVVPASLLTSAVTLNILVSNPAPGGDSVATVPVTVGNTPSILGVVNAASFAAGAVSPGEVVTIFGSNIGPTTPTPMSITGGFVDTTLAGASVKIDGKSAPMVYASQDQISVQVPYEVAIGAGKTMVITNGANSANGTVTTAATAPGIFTVNGSGSGQAAALNYDANTKLYTLNSGTNLAKIGQVVVLYLTGEGNYNSPPLSGGASDTGYIVPANLSPLPQVSPGPTVTIGGQVADVTDASFYAGPLPGSMLGLLQINAVIPVGATTGTAVPVVVDIGGKQSQTGVTLAIHP